MLAKHKRQEIIDAYLAESGRNLFVPGEFVDWLRDRPDHVAYPWIYSKTDEQAAREHRVDLARRMASGLRIVATVSEMPSEGRVVQITTRTYPAYISPLAGRQNGGGYEPVDPSDEGQLAELRKQGLIALRSWVSRYAGAFAGSEYDVSPIEALVAQARAAVRLPAASGHG